MQDDSYHFYTIKRPKSSISHYAVAVFEPESLHYNLFALCFVDRERIAKAKSIFDKRALELLNRAKLKKSKLKQKGAALPLQGHANKPDSSQVGTMIFSYSLYRFYNLL